MLGRVVSKLSAQAGTAIAGCEPTWDDLWVVAVGRGAHIDPRSTVLAVLSSVLFGMTLSPSDSINTRRVVGSEASALISGVTQ